MDRLLPWPAGASAKAAEGDGELVAEGAGISARKVSEIVVNALRSRRGDRSSLIYLGGKGCSVRCPQRDSDSIDVAVPWRLAPKAQFTTSLGASPEGLVESKNTSVESAIQCGGYSSLARLSAERRGSALPRAVHVIRATCPAAVSA